MVACGEGPREIKECRTFTYPRERVEAVMLWMWKDRAVSKAWNRVEMGE